MFTKPYEAAGNPATEMSAKWLAELVRVLEDLLWEWEYQLEPLWGFQDAFRTLLPDLYSAIDSVVRNDDSALRIGQRDFGRMRRAPLFGRVHVRVGATWKLWQIICSLERAGGFGGVSVSRGGQFETLHWSM